MYEVLNWQFYTASEFLNSSAWLQLQLQWLSNQPSTYILYLSEINYNSIFRCARCQRVSEKVSNQFMFSRFFPIIVKYCHRFPQLMRVLISVLQTVFKTVFKTVLKTVSTFSNLSKLSKSSTFLILTMLRNLSDIFQLRTSIGSLYNKGVTLKIFIKEYTYFSCFEFVPCAYK